MYWLEDSTTLLVLGCPIRIPPDRCLFTTPRGISLLIASFFRSICQDIHHTLFFVQSLLLNEIYHCFVILRTVNCIFFSDSINLFFTTFQKDLSVFLLLFSFQRTLPSDVLPSIFFWDIFSCEFDLSKPNRNFNLFWTCFSYIFLLRKEVIHPHVLVGIPCYDLTPITSPTFDGSFLAVRPPASGITSSHGMTGGVYKARERIHRGLLIRDY